MLIRESVMSGGALGLLDTIQYLDESESIYQPAMVTIRHNERLDKDLIQLESFLKFGQDNGIDDGGVAIAKICEANHVPGYEKIAFVVNEDNLYADDEILNTFLQIQESGFHAYVSPISDDSIFVTQLRDALALDEGCDTLQESVHLMRYINENVFDSAKSIVSKTKSNINDGISTISKKLASVQKEISLKIKEMASSVGSKKVIISRQISKLKDAARALKSKLLDAKSTISAKFSQGVSAAKNVANRAKAKFS